MAVHFTVLYLALPVDMAQRNFASFPLFAVMNSSAVNMHSYHFDLSVNFSKTLVLTHFGLRVPLLGPLDITEDSRVFFIYVLPK